jgi:hypothetical protein
MQDLDRNPDVCPENLKCQRSKSTTSTGNDRCRICRVSTNQGMLEIGGLMEKAIREVKESLLDSRSHIGTSSSAPYSQQPNNTAAIVSAIENNDEFSDNEKIDACKVLKNNPRIGELFIALTRPNLQTKFLRDKIIEFWENKYGIGYE